jgi:lysophospholipase L1-like esterase
LRHSLILVVAVSTFAQQPQAVLSNPDTLTHFGRVIQLMESTASTAPGLARAAEPVIENVRQGLVTLRVAASQQDGALQYDMLANARAYLALADSVPKPYPFSAEGRKQFGELRETVDRLDTHFRALLSLKEQQIRASDRDNLRRYSDANGTQSPPTPGRVVFFGDSITDGWRLNEYFPGKDYVNRGISGQITGQMLGRMLVDVVANKPAAMVLLAGTNDIARNIELTTIQSNITMIADLADKYQIKPIFASILPIHDYNKDKNPAFEMSRRRPMESIRAMNVWIKSFCAKRGYTYLDYFTPTLDEAGFLKKDLAEDGLHPNAAGYKVMAELVQSAIDRTLPSAPLTPAQEKKRRKLFGIGAK